MRLALLGLGLIGGSLARALRAAGPGAGVGAISAFDTDPEQTRWALTHGVIDRADVNPHAAVADADVVVIAVPVLRTAEALQSCVAALRPGTIVTDVGSTKVSVLLDVARVCGGAVPDWFVPGHPIAGTEKSGVANAQATLFRDHRVVLTPQAGARADAVALVESLWRACGARVVRMEPARHDEIFAATSHLPHVLAYSFVDMLARLDASGEIFPNAGGGFRDFTRVASSSPRMWHDIVRANAGSVGELLERQIGELQEILAMIRSGRWAELQALFERARAARERYLAEIE